MSPCKFEKILFPHPLFLFSLPPGFFFKMFSRFPNPSFVPHALKWFPDLLLLPSRPLPVQPPVPSQTRDPPTPCLPWQVPTLKPNKHRWHHRPAKLMKWGTTSWSPIDVGFFLIGAPQRYRPTCIPNCEGKRFRNSCCSLPNQNLLTKSNEKSIFAKVNRPCGNKRCCHMQSIPEKVSLFAPYLFRVFFLPHIRFIHFIQA